MKPSHERTPRSLDECNFAFNADPIDRPSVTSDWQDRLVLRAALVCLIALAVILWVE